MNKAFSVAAVSLIALVLAVFSMATSPAAEPEQEKKPSFWMKKKLEYSEAILVGLANGDYDSIGKTARSMGTLSQMEKWVRSSLPEYRGTIADLSKRQPPVDPDGRRRESRRSDVGLRAIDAELRELP